MNWILFYSMSGTLVEIPRYMIDMHYCTIKVGLYGKYSLLVKLLEQH